MITKLLLYPLEITCLDSVNGLMFSWRPVTSGIHQGSRLGLAVFNILADDMDSETECTLNKLADDIKVCGAVNMLEGRDAIHKDCDRLERLAHANLMKFNKAKSMVSHMGQSQAQIQDLMEEKTIPYTSICVAFDLLEQRTDTPLNPPAYKGIYKHSMPAIFLNLA
ncbi:hypothetical protein WISP_20456 [Willisornis vidua]|uniref:Reverse transcriptase domain-containing protein n=1 Tax=Willisornis vidua TaxID=1566151 RepID=A0ABQ9DSN6_9PASS|nr:hypothetical protein WISP_20456 [Willisornis vidua]